MSHLIFKFSHSDLVTDGLGLIQFLSELPLEKSLTSLNKREIPFEWQIIIVLVIEIWTTRCFSELKISLLKSTVLFKISNAKISAPNSSRHFWTDFAVAVFLQCVFLLTSVFRLKKMFCFLKFMYYKNFYHQRGKGKSRKTLRV